MAVTVLLARSVLSARFHPLLCLLLLIGIGALSYAGALLAFHRRRVGSLIRTIWGMFQQERRGEDAAIASI
jgi:hypothetical protein